MWRNWVIAYRTETVVGENHAVRFFDRPIVVVRQQK